MWMQVCFGRFCFLGGFGVGKGEREGGVFRSIKTGFVVISERKRSWHPWSGLRISRTGSCRIHFDDISRQA